MRRRARSRRAESVEETTDESSVFARERTCYSRRVSFFKRVPRAAGGWVAFLLLLALVFTASAAPQKTSASPPLRPSRSTERPTPRGLQFEALSLERSGQNHLLLRAFINGKPALLVVDTGAPMSLIAINRLAYFGMLPGPPNGDIPKHLQINGTAHRVTTARSLQLGVLNLIDEPMVAIDFGDIAKASQQMGEQPIDGIIGTDILFPTNAVLDCRAQRLFLKMDPSVRGGVTGIDYHGFTQVPIHVSDGLGLYVDGRFNGRRAKLRIDTGAFGTLFHQSFIRTMKIPLRESGIVSALVNLEQRGLKLATIARFSIGSFDMQNKVVGVTDLAGIVSEALPDASRPDAGLLGAEILQRHHGIIDFGSRTLYLKR